jgi:hypothetical protein
MQGSIVIHSWFPTFEPLAKSPGDRHYEFRWPSGAMACSEGVAASHTTYPPTRILGVKYLFS